MVLGLSSGSRDPEGMSWLLEFAESFKMVWHVQGLSPWPG